MAAMDNALNPNGGRFAPLPDQYAANIIDSGQLGFGPMLRNLDGNTPPVFTSMEVIVTHVPEIFRMVPNGAAFFKAWLELNLVSMDGVDPTYSMDVEGVQVGRDGQQMMVPMKQTRAQLTPSTLTNEKVGNVIWNAGRFWFDNMRHIDTQHATLAALVASGATFPPHVMSMYAADIMLIQHDTTRRPENIIDAMWLTNFFPTDIGSPGYQVNVAEVHRPDRTFTYTCVMQQNANTKAMARRLASITQLHTVDFDYATPLGDGLDPGLENMGQAYQASTWLSNFTNLAA